MSLSKIQSLRIAAVLEGCSRQLDVLKHIFSAQNNARVIKLVKDCQSISQQISSLQLELQEQQSFKSFLQDVEEKEQEQGNDNKEKESETNANLKQRMSNLLRQQQEILDKSEKFQTLFSYCEHLREMTTLKKANMKKISAQKPMQKKNREAEKQLEEELEQLQEKIKEEKRVHEKAEEFLRNKQQELEQVLQNSQQSTKQMLQEKEDQLNSTSCKRTLNIDRMMEMRRKLRVMQQVVIEDLEEQERLRQRQAEVAAATKLQAWWRCCMVRWGLGPFKKAKENKKGKKKKEKKKK